MISRRNLLQGIFAAGIAPAIVKAEILMPARKIIVPEWSDAIVARMRLLRDMEMAVNPPLIGRHKHWSLEANGRMITWIETPTEIRAFQQFSMKGTT